jgi:hypothetical protein
MATTMDSYAALLGALKDIDSNVRSEISYLDRNVTNGMSASVANIIQNSNGNAVNTRGEINRVSDFMINDSRRNTDTLAGTIERQNILAQNLGESRFKDLKDVGHRNSDFALNDARRNADFALNDTRRNTEFLSAAVERNGTAGVLATQAAASALGSAIERTGTAATLATHNAEAEITAAMERNNIMTNTNSYNHAKDIISSVERNGIQGTMATERNGTMNLAETIRNSGQIRDLINHQSSENRNQLQNIAMQQFQLAKESALAAKETDLKVAESAFKTQQQTAAILTDMGRIKSELERQAADNAAMAARDMALLSRDILTSKGEIMKQASDNTAAIQLEALKNKDSLSCQIHSSYDKLVGLNTDRIRDNLNDYRAENVGLRYGDWHHHRHHFPDIHNNLYSNLDRGRGFDIGERGGFGPGPGPR